MEGDPHIAFWAANWRSTFNAARSAFLGVRSLRRRGSINGTRSTRKSSGAGRIRSPSRPARFLNSAPVRPCLTGSGSGRGIRAILGLVVDYVRMVVSRYQGKSPSLASASPAGLRRVSRLVGGRADPDRDPGHPGRATRPTPRRNSRSESTGPGPNGWATAPFRLGPLYLADYLVRADLGLSGIAIEIARDIRRREVISATSLSSPSSSISTPI